MLSDFKLLVYTFGIRLTEFLSTISIVVNIKHKIECKIPNENAKLKMYICCQARETNPRNCISSRYVQFHVSK